MKINPCYIKDGLIVDHCETFNVLDKIAFNRHSNKEQIGPLGWVKVFLSKNGKHEKIYDDHNLIVAIGKEFVAQKVFDIYNTDEGTFRENWTNFAVSHFAVGSGGATDNSNVVELHAPHISDIGLAIPIRLGDELYLSEPRKIEKVDSHIHSYHNAVKPIRSDGSIHLEPVQYENTIGYTKVLSTCIVPPGEPSGLQEGESVQISEAGLYFVDKNTANQNNDGAVRLFSRIAFAPKWLELESALTIFWYVLF
jgi:hypothetical protein